MEVVDDDFGDLYADVEAKASSAINGGRDLTRFQTEDDSDTDSSKANENPSSEDGNGSESEDDLNIVLNDEDCQGKRSLPGVEQVIAKNNEDNDGFVVPKDEEVKNIRTHGSHRSSIPCNVKTNGSTSVLARCVWNYNGRGRHKGPSSGQNDVVGATRSSVMTQSRCGFSLPWYRSILDVNIDTFEEKPWRYAGIDITDFFNFGFNEDSWRQYCNSLEQLRLQAFTQLGNSNHVPQNQAYEVGSMYDEQVEETMNDSIDQPKGRAIQVEDGEGERQPSADVRRPHDRDSDVVIQITLENPIEDTSDPGEKLDHSGSSQVETSNNMEADASDDRAVPRLSGAQGDEVSVEYLEENDKSADRCSEKTSSSNRMTEDPDDTEKNQSTDVDRSCHEETCAFSSDGSIELPEIVNETQETVVLRGSCEDRYTAERELSLEKEGQLSLSSSCFESDSEASRDDSHLDCGKVSSPLRRSSVKSGAEGAELWDSDTSRHKNLKGNYAKKRPVGFRDYFKCKIPVQGERKHRTRIVERKIIANNDHASCQLDAEDMDDKGHLSAKYGRWKNKLEDVDFTDREDIAYYEKSKQAYCYGSREFAKDRTHTARKNYRNRSQDFYERRDPYLTFNRKERGYLCEDERREGYRYRQGPFSRGMPVACKETGHLVSRYSATSEEMDFQSKRKNNKLRFRKPTNHSSQFPDYELDNADFMQERCASSVSLINRKRHTLDETYERQVPKHLKAVKNSGWKRYKDAISLELEGAWSRETEDEYWSNTNVHYLSRHSYRESDDERWAELEGSWSRRIEHEYWGNTDVHHLSHQSYRESNGGRWTDPMSPRNGVGFVQRYRRQLPAGEGRESGWFEKYNDPHKFEDGIFYPDDGVHCRRKRRCGWKSEVLPWAEEELTVRHPDEKLSFEKASFFCKKDGRQRRNQSTHGPLHDAMHIDNMQADKHGYEMTRDGSDTRCIYRSQKMYRAKNEQAFLRSRDSVGFCVGEGKLSRRRPMDRNLSCRSRLESSDQDDFDESPRYKTVQPQSDLPKVGLNQSNEDFHNQLPRAAQNEDFDIEEGQIVTEEPCMGDSVSPTRTHNAKKRMLEDDLASHAGKTEEAYNDQWILETLAKMERRRERFKEPITLKREQEKCTKPDIFPPPTVVETPETKQHRPARKRQWCTGQGS